jgi:hypothetical protein
MNAPTLKVIRGDATPEEIAALVAVLTARARRAAAGPAIQRSSGWADRSRGLRTPLPHGPGAWRAGARPR